MHQKGIHKLALTRLLMIASQVLLLCFVAYWLREQYSSEREELKKDLTVQLDHAQQQVSNDVISIFLGELMKKERQQAPGRINVEMEIRDTLHRLRGPALIEKRRTRAAGTAPTRMIYYRHDSLPGNVLTQSMKLVLKSTRDLPDSLERHLLGLDTAGLSKAFKSGLIKKGWRFTSRWVDNKQAADVDKYIYLDQLRPLGHYSLQVGAFSGYLLRRMPAQFLFALTLLLLTGFSFRLAYRSLREQMELAAIRNDFISNMSHELKTPVATVKVALEALSDPEVLKDTATTRDYVAIAALETGRLEQLIHQTLQTSLLEAGKVVLHEEVVDLHQLVAEVARIMASGQHHSIAVDPKGADFRVTGDKLQLQGVLVNLVDNALKYGSGDQDITARITEEMEWIAVDIADKGPGIPEAYLGKVFEKFFRVPTGNEHNVKGYGLGLSYAAQVITQHKGRIGVHNNPGGGCTFTIRLPKRTA